MAREATNEKTPARGGRRATRAKAPGAGRLGRSPWPDLLAIRAGESFGWPVECLPAEFAATVDAAPQPQQADLDELMHCIATGKQYVWEPAPPPNGG